MTTPETQQLKELIADLKREMTKRMDEMDAKIDKGADFQTVFLGIARVLMWGVLVVGGLVTIYAGLHGGVFSSAGAR